MKTLIKQILLYSDGTYEIIDTESPTEIFETQDEQQTLLYNQIDDIFADPIASMRIKVNVATYVLSKYLYDAKENNAVSKAFDILSKKLSVTRNTIVDKTYRQLNMKAEEYIYLVNQAIRPGGNTDELKNLLLDFVGTRTKNADKILINKYL